MQLLVCADWTDWEQQGLNDASADYPLSIDTLRQRWKPTRRALRYVASVLEATRVVRAMRRYDAAFVWQQVVGVAVAAIAPDRLLRRCPVVIMGFMWSSSGGGLLRAARGMATSRAVRRAAAIVCYSSREADDLRRRYPLAADKIHFVLLGFDVPSPPCGAADVLHRVAVSAGTSNRDYATLLEAATLAAVPVRIHAPRCETAMDPNDPAQVAWVQPFAWEEYFRELSVAGVVVIPLDEPDKTSGQLVALQAMHYGRAIVATRSAALADYLQDDRTALLVEPHDAKALADAMSAVLADAALAHRLGTSAHAFARQHLSSRAFWGATLAIATAALPRAES
jgi:glycosyltransferase involved in cell wall biosynthesis